MDPDGDTERTTASIKSMSSPIKSPFDDNDESTAGASKSAAAATMKESSSEGRMKRFFNDIKNNCKTADTVVESKLLFPEPGDVSSFPTFAIFLPFASGRLCRTVRQEPLR